MRLETSPIREKGGHEAKGWWRPTFKFDVKSQTFDRFFNSQYGYRGQYFDDVYKGEKQNSLLISEISSQLVNSTNESSEVRNEILQSLTSSYSKICIDEGQHNPKTPDLIIQIRVKEWEEAARQAFIRLQNSDPTILPKEIDRIFGIRAPEGKTLKITGAWIDSNGTFRIVPSKLQRPEDIKLYGIS